MPPKKRSTGTPFGKEIKQPDVVISTAKGISDLSSDRHKYKNVEFMTLSEKLKVNDHVCDHAWNIWDKVQASKDIILDTNLKVWGACLFIAAVDLGVMTFTFTEVQKAVDLNVKQFFNLLKKLDVNLDTISTNVNGAMVRLEKKYEVSHAVFQRFEKLCGKIYADAPDSKGKLTPDGKQIIRTCWTLFLLAKGSVLEMEDDLVISFQLLMCVLEFCIRHSPPSVLLQPYKSATNSLDQPMTRTSRRNDSKAKVRCSEVNLRLLETLCKENECSVDEVRLHPQRVGAENL